MVQPVWAGRICAEEIKKKEVSLNLKGPEEEYLSTFWLAVREDVSFPGPESMSTEAVTVSVGLSGSILCTTSGLPRTPRVTTKYRSRNCP